VSRWFLLQQIINGVNNLLYVRYVFNIFRIAHITPGLGSENMLQFIFLCSHMILSNNFSSCNTVVAVVFDYCLL